MSNKIKFKKLQLPKNARSNSANQLPNSQISKFFSNNNNKNENKSNYDNSQENTISSSLTNENSNSNNTVLIISDEDSNNTDYKLTEAEKPINTSKDGSSFRFSSVNCNGPPEACSTSKCTPQYLLKSESNENSQLNLESDDFQETKIPALKTKISKFFDEHINDDSFETPYIPPKKTKLADDENVLIKMSSNQSKLPAKRKRKKKITIKSAFTKNEEIFTDIMAQHSIADNFNPDDIQMALALSMSENQEQNNICDDLNNDNKSENLNIRDKLQTFGFKTGEKKDYNLDFYIPIVNKKKTKWANRFTALTLRNAEKQLRKLNNNIEQFLNNQNSTIYNLNFDSKYEYETCSSYLQNLHTNYEFIKKCNFVENESDLENFYITELFTPSTAKIGSLMKKYENIPGRNISPKRNTKVYVESDLELTTSNEKKNISILEELHDEVDLNKLNQNNMRNCNISFDSGKIEQNLNAFSNGEETLKHEKFNTEILIDSAINLENEPGGLGKDVSQNLQLSDIDQDQVGLTPTVKGYINRHVRSPDLFSDNEFDISNENEDKQDVSITDDIECSITHFEKFSSDEVKIFHINSLNNNSPKSSPDFLEENANNMSIKVIDLTQEDKIEDHSSSNVHLNFIGDSKEDINSQDLNCSDSDCIILSDDEVNYSMALAGSVKNNISVTDKNEYDKKEFSILELIEDENEDLTSSNDNEKVCIDIKNLDDFKDKKTPVSPFEYIQNSRNLLKKKKSFTKISSKCRKSISESFSKLNHNDLSMDSTRTSFRQKSLDNELKEDCFRFAPLEIIDCTDEAIDQNNLSKITNNLNISKISDGIGDEDFAEDDFDLTKLRNKFGIHKTPNRDTIKKTMSECVASNYSNRSSYKRYSSNILFDDILETENEFDIVLHSPEIKSSTSNIPKNLDQLLTADIISSTSGEDSNDSFNLSKLQKKFGIEKTPKKKLYHKTVSESTVLTSASKIKFQPSTSLKRHLTNINEDASVSSLHNNSQTNTFKKLGKHLIESNEIRIDNRTYEINTINVPEKPDYEKWDIIEIHRELDKYGVKPLKKKQGIIILEYIYNQTHPYIIENETRTNPSESMENKINAGDNMSKKYTENPCNSNCNLEDCFGDKLCSNDGLLPELRNEKYIFQTNISKKILTALVPLHIAWYNLIKSNYKLRERVLKYEPVDLQEIYLFFKSIGYRYDPKDIKRFFDDRCIIFRFDLSESTNNRHIKKSKSKSNK